MNQKDFVASIVTSCIGILGLLGINRLNFGTLNLPGPAFLPCILSALVIILSLVLLIKSARTKERIKLPAIGEKWKKLIPAIGAMMSYAILLRPLGYLLCTFSIVILFVRLSSGSWKAALLLSSLCTFISYGILKLYLNTPLPQGIFAF